MSSKPCLELSWEGLFKASVYFTPSGRVDRVDVAGLGNAQSAVFSKLENDTRAFIRGLEALGVLSNDRIVARLVEFLGDKRDLFSCKAHLGLDAQGRCVLLV